MSGVTGGARSLTVEQLKLLWLKGVSRGFKTAMIISNAIWVIACFIACLLVG